MKPFIHSSLYFLGLLLTLPVFGQSLCPIGSFQASASAMTKPSAYSLCDRRKLLEILETVRALGRNPGTREQTQRHLGVPNLKEWVSQVEASIQQALNTRDSLVKVESQILDLSLNQFKRVSGLGTVLVTGPTGPLRSLDQPTLLNARYFVLTASHLVSNSTLKIQASADLTLPVRGVHFVPGSDLALVELDRESESHALPLPLGYWFSNGHQDFLLTHLRSVNESDPRNNSFGLQKDSVSSNFFRIYTCDDFQSSVLSRGEQAGVLTPTWGVPLVNTCRLGYKNQISRDPNVPSHTFDLLLKSGLSGAPIVIPYPLNGYDRDLKRFFYVIGGVVATTSREQSQSLAQAQGIRETLTAILNPGAKSIQAGTTEWYLIDDIFVSAGETLDLYTKSDPIGNGIIIEGYKPPDKARLQFEKYLEDRGVEAQQRLQIQEALRDLRSVKSPQERRQRLQNEFSRLSEQTNLKIRTK